MNNNKRDIFLGSNGFYDQQNFHFWCAGMPKFCEQGYVIPRVVPVYAFVSNPAYAGNNLCGFYKLDRARNQD